MNSLSSIDIEAAIYFIGFDRYSHEVWVQHLAAGKPASEDVGDIAHHERCILEYDHILDVLNTVLEEKRGRVVNKGAK